MYYLRGHPTREKLQDICKEKTSNTQEKYTYLTEESLLADDYKKALITIKITIMRIKI